MSLLLLASALPPELTSQLDKMMRADLDTWSSLWFWVLVGSTVAVVIGIICEAPEVWQAIGLGRKTVRRMDDLNGWERLCPELLAKNHHPRKWIAAIGFVGWTFVALGVAGEGVAEYFVNDAETDIRSFDEASLSETTRTAGDARLSAEGAAKAASDAKVASGGAVASASTALSLADGARKEADSFEKDIVSAKTQAAEAEAHLADATQRTLRLEQQLSWRTVDQEQLEVMKRHFCPFRSKQLLPFLGTKVGLTYVTGDAEGAEYADELLTALRKTLGRLGAEITDPASIVVLGRGHPPMGLTLQVKDPKSALAVSLQRGLNDAGIEAPGEVTQGIEGDVNLFVATKPKEGVTR
jgi:hypothetical protein